MKRVLIAALLAAGSAIAAPVAVFQGENLKVYAYLDDCDVASLSSFLSQYGKPRKAAVQFQGKEYRACYVLRGDQVLVADEAGDAGYIPAAAFTEAQGA